MALTMAQRKKMPKSQFAIPEKAPGPGSYPIGPTRNARNALTRVEQHGSPEEKARVRRAVARVHPEIQQSKGPQAKTTGAGRGNGNGGNSNGRISKELDRRLEQRSRR
jgi:hypothetical protein